LALALGLIDAGAYDEALDVCRRALAGTQPRDDSDFTWYYARALWFTGAHNEAITAFEHLPPGARPFLGYMYAKIGRRSDAERLDFGNRHNALRYDAFLYAGLGDKDRVLDTFEKMAVAHDHIVDIYPLFPEFALMRDDPRMKEFRHKRNLPWPP
jgi:tetratricopeptide (TPR) repeat protein